MVNSKTSYQANKLESFSCLLATIDKCNILKSVLGWHKLASTANQTMFEIHKLARTDRGFSAWREAVVAAVATMARRTMGDIPGSVHFCPLVSRGWPVILSLQASNSNPLYLQNLGHGAPSTMHNALHIAHVLIWAHTSLLEAI